MSKFDPMKIVIFEALTPLKKVVVAKVFAIHSLGNWKSDGGKYVVDSFATLIW